MHIKKKASRKVYCYTNLIPCKQEMFATYGQRYVYMFAIKGFHTQIYLQPWRKPVPSGRAWSFLGGDFIVLTFIYGFLPCILCGEMSSISCLKLCLNFYVRKQILRKIDKLLKQRGFLLSFQVKPI